jgi:hypothetical protein
VPRSPSCNRPVSRIGHSPSKQLASRSIRIPAGHAVAISANLIAPGGSP